MNNMEKILKEKLVNRGVEVEEVEFIDSYNFIIITKENGYGFTYEDEELQLKRIESKKGFSLFPKEPIDNFCKIVDEALEDAAKDPKIKIEALLLLVPALTKVVNRSGDYKMSDALSLMVVAVKDLEDDTDKIKSYNNSLLEDFKNNKIQDKNIRKIISGIFNILNR